MLRSVRDLDKLRVIASDTATCGRIKDAYFNDRSWAIQCLVVALDPRQFGAKQVILSREQIAFSPADAISVRLRLRAEDLSGLPLATSILPVCRQYAKMALGSPGASRFAAHLAGADPHLRSVRAVANYCINVAGQCGGTLSDFLFDDESWNIRYLAIEQLIDGRRIAFHLLPQSVERFTWATQRILLRALQPVEIAAESQPELAVA